MPNYLEELTGLSKLYAETLDDKLSDDEDFLTHFGFTVKLI